MMAVAKSVRTDDASVSGGSLRLRGTRPARDDAQKVVPGTDLAEIAVAKRSLKTLREHKGAVSKMLASYAGAVEKAERLGRSFELVIKVTPDHAEPALEARPADGDALDRALGAARQRGASRAAEIIKAPDMLTAREFGRLIGASHET